MKVNSVYEVCGGERIPRVLPLSANQVAFSASNGRTVILINSESER